MLNILSTAAADPTGTGPDQVDRSMKAYESKPEDFGIDDFGIDDFGIDGFGIDDFGIDDFGIDDFSIDDFGIDDKTKYNHMTIRGRKRRILRRRNSKAYDRMII